jgi:hypothetical protein
MICTPERVCHSPFFLFSTPCRVVDQTMIEPFNCHLLLKPAIHNNSLLLDLFDNLVAVRISRLPPPGVFAHVIDAQFSFPFEEILCHRRVSVHGCYVSRTTRGHCIWYWFSTGPCHTVNELQDRNAVSSSKIYGLAANFVSV